jgi:hypothetical protein
MRILFLFYVILIFMACTDKEQRLTGRYTGNQTSGIGQVDSPITIVIEQNSDTIKGSVTPPFSNDLVPFENAKINGTSVQFDRKEGQITFRYLAVFNPAESSLQGEYQPLGCMDPDSGEPCQTDSEGSFRAEKE